MKFVTKLTVCSVETKLSITSYYTTEEAVRAQQLTVRLRPMNAILHK